MIHKLFAITCFLLATATVVGEERFSAEDIAFFETKVRPVLVTHCQDCHSGEEPESRFSVEFREAFLTGGEFGPAAKPGKPTESLLISAIKHDEFLKMPPKEKLTSAQVVDLTRWVEMGLPWPEEKSGITANIGQSSDALTAKFTEEQKTYWAFQPPKRSSLPAVNNNNWPQTPIDYFILAELEAANLIPATQSNKRTLIRRATFDLTGLPPTPEEISTFVSDDSPDAYSNLIDRLLGSPRYGERWGRHWLDVARYADSNGLDENLSYEFAYQYRDYVIRAMNLDKPYGEFVKEQIAGDLMPQLSDKLAAEDRRRATGFLAIGPKMLAEDDPVKMQMDIIDEQVNTLGQAFMGLTLGCARCHDHKFDPIPTADYYSLAGIFKSTKSMENYNVVADWYEHPLLSPTASAKLKQLTDEIAVARAEQNKLNRSVVEIVENELQHRADRYLLAARAVGSLDEAITAGGITVHKKQDEPFTVTNGYLAVEAEAAHRTTLSILSASYGKEIGIVGSGGDGGYAEFDILVNTPGTYTLEIRYAALDSRSIGVKLDDQMIADNILGKVTGSWFPDTQTWVAEVEFELTQGQHVLKLDSPKVYPHIDKLALVLQPEADIWPFDTPAPPSLTTAGREHDINPTFLSSWLWYLGSLTAAKLQTHPFLETWLALVAIEDADFATKAKPKLEELQTEEGLGTKAPPVLKALFAKAPPSSIEDVAILYRRLIVDSHHANKNLGDDAKVIYKEVFDEISKGEFPTSTPNPIPATAYPEDQMEQRQAIAKTINELESQKPVFEIAMGVTEGTPEDIKIHLRGSHITLGRTVPRQMLQIIEGSEQEPITGTQSGRLELANWLAQPQHPLVNRVMANRVWRWHFGTGIVSSVDNFGTLGEPPTHPELLDYLALELTENGGSLKQLHRQIMLSATYQMSTTYSEQGNTTDPENKLLWRFNRRRLTGEEIRDSVLALGPGLDTKMGGTLLKVKNRAYVTGSNTNITDEFDNYRRSVYLPVVRSSVYEVLQALDFPDPAVSNGDRNTTTVAPQALFMMNSSLVDASTLALASSLIASNSSDRIERAYSVIMGRTPNEQEIVDAQAYTQQVTGAASSAGIAIEDAELAAWQSFCRVLLSTNEFFYVE
ncbi:MAG: hypothetical protein CMM02_19405 [Rhodopirellula sp.]|nr:hypothetical protein [Rhodopirellula sp.]